MFSDFWCFLLYVVKLILTNLRLKGNLHVKDMIFSIYLYESVCVTCMYVYITHTYICNTYHVNTQVRLHSKMTLKKESELG